MAAEALRHGDFRMVSAEQGSGLIVYTRKLGKQQVTVYINSGKGSANLPQIKGSIYWSDGLKGETLCGNSFAVFSSCEA